jgi:membrane protein implicated in regulation of membrane protease activity
MDTWVIWIILGVALLILEATTTAFVAVYFGVAAIVAAIVGLAGGPLALQILAFAITAFGAMYLTRPALRRAANKGPGLRTGVDAMRGRKGIVTKAIAELESGQVRIDGDIWSARSFFDGEQVPVGTKVEVVEIKGVTALVLPVHGSEDEQLEGATS